MENRKFDEVSRMSAIKKLRQKVEDLRYRAIKIEKLANFLQHWEEINGKLDNDIEGFLWEIACKL